MEATITNIQDRVVTVVFTLDDESTLTKKMDLQPNDAGDPFDDLQTFFKSYMQAYLAGKVLEAENTPSPSLVGEIYNLD